MRDGNWVGPRGHERHVLRFEPTYEGWKHSFCDMPIFAVLSFEPTYEGWKPMMRGDAPSHRTERF